MKCKFYREGITTFTGCFVAHKDNYRFMLRSDKCYDGNAYANCCAYCDKRLECYDRYKEQHGNRSRWGGPILCKPLREFIRDKKNKFLFAMTNIEIVEDKCI